MTKRAVAGFTIIEVLITMFVSLILISTLSSSYGKIVKVYKSSKINASAERQIENTKTRIRLSNNAKGASFNLLQVLDEDYKNFPLFWSEQINLLNELECKEKFGSSKCPLQGRLNYLVVPTAGGHGLYIAKIAIYHPELNGGQIKKATFYLTLGR